jgi:hypothetical protein
VTLTSRHRRLVRLVHDTSKRMCHSRDRLDSIINNSKNLLVDILRRDDLMAFVLNGCYCYCSSDAMDDIDECFGREILRMLHKRMVATY